MKNINYIPRKGKIIGKKILAEDIASIEIKLLDKKPFSFIPGQFILVTVLGFGEIPLGISSLPAKKNSFEVTFRAVGLVTEKLFGMSIGEYVGISGPFGNGFPMTHLKNKDLVVVSGGIGLAPIRSLILHIEKKPQFVKSLTLLHGARCEEQLIYREEYSSWSKFTEVNLTVDDCGTDWSGCVGNVTKLYDKVKIKRGSTMIVCGPPKVYKSIIDRYAGKTIAEKDLYFLLERRMDCGVGKCQHCTCGKYYVCLDGPVFSYDKIKYNKEVFS